MEHISTLIGPVVDDLEDLYARGPASVPVRSTGLHLLDHLTGGLDGRPWVIRGSRGTGRTALVLHLARSLLFGEGPAPAVIYVSTDLAPRTVALRMLSPLARIPADRIESGRLGGSDWARLAAAVSGLTKAPFFVVDGRGTDAAGIADRIVTSSNHDPGGAWVIVDSLDRVGGDPQWRLSDLTLQLGLGLVVVTGPGSTSSAGRVVIELEAVGEMRVRLTVARGAVVDPGGGFSPTVSLSIRPSDLMVHEQSFSAPRQADLFSGLAS